MDELGEKIDGLIVGGYWGQGSRGGRLASFLVGLRGTKNGKEVYVRPSPARPSLADTLPIRSQLQVVCQGRIGTLADGLHLDRVRPF